jgi:hypothetical protein
VVRVDPSLGLSYRCGLVMFDDLSNGPFRRLRSAIPKNLTYKVPALLFVAIALNPNAALDIYLLAKLELVFYICILLNRIKQPNFLYSPLWPYSNYSLISTVLGVLSSNPWVP